jgi:hypothetical protein
MSTFYSPVAIQEHLMKYLPRLTDRFSDNAIVSADIIAGTPQILRITDPLHGLSVNDPIVLIDSLIDNVISAVQDNGDGSYRFTTAEQHDLTQDYTTEIELAGFTDSQFNGIFQLLTVPGRNIFEIELPVLPALTGNPVLREDREIGINGVFTITRIIDVDIYEIDLTGKPFFTPQTIPILRRAKNFNINICVTADRATELYQSNGIGKNMIFIIMGVSNISKDQTITSDAIQQNSSGTESRPLNMNNFSLNVYFDTTNDVGGANASQLAYEEIYQVLLAVCSGIRFDDFKESNYLTTLINHEPDLYEKAFYSHMYIFEYNFEITQEEQFLTKFIESRRFNDSALGFSEQQEGSTIDLDGN